MACFKEVATKGEPQPENYTGLVRLMSHSFPSLPINYTKLGFLFVTILASYLIGLEKIGVPPNQKLMELSSDNTLDGGCAVRG